MVKFRGNTSKGQMIGFGLSRENINRLIEGKPIVVEGTELGLPCDVTIMFGETENDIAAELTRAGWITPDTTVHRDPRLNEPHQEGL